MNLPEIVSRNEWRQARIELLVEEKAMTRARDALSTKRRMLPMVRLDKEYTFDGPDGPATMQCPGLSAAVLILRHHAEPQPDPPCR